MKERRYAGVDAKMKGKMFLSQKDHCIYVPRGISFLKLVFMLTLIILVSTALLSSILAMTASNDHRFNYELNVVIKGFNITSDDELLEHASFRGTALISVKPINSTFSNVTVVLKGLIIPGIRNGFITMCHGSIPNISCEILTTNLTQNLRSRNITVAISYVVMNKYNYAWEMRSGRFIGFFPLYVVPDVNFSNVHIRKYVYLGKTLFVCGGIVNELTGAWSPIPVDIKVKDSTGRNVELSTIQFYNGLISINVIHHYPVMIWGAFVLPHNRLGEIYMGNYTYVLMTGIVPPSLVDHIKSIDDYPEWVSVITWGWVERIIIVGIGIASCIALGTYLIIRRRRRVRG